MIMALSKYLPSVRALLLFLISLSGAYPLLADNAQAETLLRQGRVDEAEAILTPSLVNHPDDAEAHLLLCRVYYAQDMADAAIRECELAAASNPSSSDDQFWLGKSYGLKASHANMLSAFSLARKVHAAFEKAVQLDPKNVVAMSALGDYYVRAPSIVGGGLDKAEALVPRMRPLSLAKTYRLQALIADKKNDTTTAEADFKSAIAVGKTPETYIDLSLFYQEHSEADKAVTVLQNGLAANRIKNASLVDAASILIELHRSPDVAERALREYLSSPAKSDDAPAFKAHLQLGDLLLQNGDTTGAHQEYAAAASLAANYPPVHKASKGS
jgi:tetratricopeptide (TPR) repeat protein